MYRRDVSKPIQLIRSLLLGRSWNYQNRFQDMLSPRPYPKPHLVTGCAHKPYENHYVFRDPRRATLPPKELPTKLIGEQPTTGAKSDLPPTPGPSYNWDRLMI